MALAKRLAGMARTRGDERGVLGVAQRGVAEQRADGGEARVAGPGTVVPLGFQVVQEGAITGASRSADVQRGGRLAGLALHEAEQQPERVPVGGDGVAGWPGAGRSAVR